MSDPKTQEYLEAEQESINRTKEKIINELNALDQKKFEVVENIVKELTNNNINFHLYVFLPNTLFNNKDVVWQYNSLTALAKFDNSGKLTKESNELIGLFCAGMLTKIFEDVTNFKVGKDASFKDRWTCFQEYVYVCLSQYYDFLRKNDIRSDKKKEE